MNTLTDHVMSVGHELQYGNLGFSTLFSHPGLSPSIVRSQSSALIDRPGSSFSVDLPGTSASVAHPGSLDLLQMHCCLVLYLAIKEFLIMPCL